MEVETISGSGVRLAVMGEGAFVCEEEEEGVLVVGEGEDVHELSRGGGVWVELAGEEGEEVGEGEGGDGWKVGRGCW